jgi:hypothetical protein
MLSMHGRRGAAGVLASGLGVDSLLNDAHKRSRGYRVFRGCTCALLGGVIQIYNAKPPMMFELMKHVRPSLPVCAPSARCVGERANASSWWSTRQVTRPSPSNHPPVAKLTVLLLGNGVALWGCACGCARTGRWQARPSPSIAASTPRGVFVWQVCASDRDKTRPAVVGA